MNEISERIRKSVTEDLHELRSKLLADKNQKVSVS